MGNAPRQKGMNRGFVLVCLLCLVPLHAGFADSFRERIAYGNALLNSGNFEGAREVYRNLQIEYPEHETVYYSLGCADYEEALQAMAHRDPEGAFEGFAAARDAFRSAMTSRERWLRRDAHYNHANSLAQLAKLAGLRQDQEGTIAAFEEAVGAYEDVLERYPEHAGAQHNLDHMRYLLKRMLQNPPPPPEEEEGDSQDEQRPGDQQDKPDGTEEPESQDDPGEGTPQPQPDEQDSEQDEQQPGEQAAAMSEEDMAQHDGEEDMQDRQTLEAILQSLEAEDRREQQELRTSPPDTTFRREWW